MVKPQSSKLITRVRFPSSPPLQRLRRKRRGLLRSGDAGNRFRAKIQSLARSGFSPSSPSSPRALISGNPFRMRIYFLARSESARSSSSSPPHIPPKVARNRLRAKIQSLARSGFSPSSPSSPRELIWESLPHADLFPRALGIRMLQLVIPSHKFHPRLLGFSPSSSSFPRTNPAQGCWDSLYSSIARRQ